MRTAVARASVRLARAHGLFNVLGGSWPLVHMRSFEAVTGPKVDRWLVRTVSGLMVANGAVQLRAEPSRDGVTAARRIGMGTALVLATVDVVYGGRHRISRMYLVDAVLETGWLVAWTWWAASSRHGAHRPRTRARRRAGGERRRSVTPVPGKGGCPTS